MTDLERLIEAAQKARKALVGYQSNAATVAILDIALKPFASGVDAYFAAQEKSRHALYDKAVADLKVWKAMQRENRRIAQEQTP